MKNRNNKWTMRLKVDSEPRRPATVHQILRERRTRNYALASRRRHLRAVARFGDDGMRCFECRYVPLLPWEPVLERNEWGATL